MFAIFDIHILYAHVVLYLRTPWKIGESQMGHPRKIKNLLTLLTNKFVDNVCRFFNNAPMDIIFANKII